MTDKDARREFRRLAKLLGSMGLIGSADSNLLTRYCLAWLRWKRVVQTLAQSAGAEVTVYKDESGKPKSMQVSALHSVARNLADELSRAEAALGMSPSSRSRIEVTMPTTPATDPLSRFFADVPMRN